MKISVRLLNVVNRLSEHLSIYFSDKREFLLYVDVWEKNDGSGDKTNTERLSWCQKGHAAETNYTVSAEYDSKFFRQDILLIRDRVQYLLWTLGCVFKERRICRGYERPLGF